LNELSDFCSKNYLPLFGAALSDRAADVRKTEIHRAAVCIGSEGRGLSKELLDLCGGEIIIPMNPDAESLNAAVAASVLMWEMTR
ncbi:MAG: TrmH family RNA methyltransferase, partial [Bacillota bacterium]|nr:TrmH family RNA methyltransferase [Bacillota bacterium]